MCDERVLYVRVRVRTCVNKSGRLWIMSPPQFPLSPKRWVINVFQTFFVWLMKVALTLILMYVGVYMYMYGCFGHMMYTEYIMSLWSFLVVQNNFDHLPAFSWITCFLDHWLCLDTKTSQCLCNLMINHSSAQVFSYYFTYTHTHTHTPIVPPPPPTNIRLMVISDNSIRVTWNPPTENPTNRPLTYNVYTSLDGGERFPVVGGINATNYTIMSKI
jgi:hypothetical protein